MTDAQLVVAETEVFAANSPNPAAWTDLDISAVVGSNVALVMFKVMLTTSGGNKRFSMRKNGDTEISHLGNIGVSGIFNPGSGSFNYVICPTDASGIVEWYYENAADAVTIDVVAFIPGA